MSLKGSCAIPALARVVYVPWTNPDPLHISISSANNSSNGLATCIGPTDGPVSLTATDAGPNNTATATVQLTCH